MSHFLTPWHSRSRFFIHFAFKANITQTWSVASAIDAAGTEMPPWVLHAGPITGRDPS